MKEYLNSILIHILIIKWLIQIMQFLKKKNTFYIFIVWKKFVDYAILNYSEMFVYL